MTSSTGARRAALRRYPALGYLAGAVALALLLPSGLTLPNSGPATLAEYAPVPGQGQGSGDVSEFGQATSSGGAGSGAGFGGASTTTTPTLAGGEAGRLRRKAGNKNCVGSPPRQTEDPLSPPCVAFFEGDNGGATTAGVTAETITVVLQLDDIANDRRADQLVDCSTAPESEEPPEDILCKAFIRYFNERYQTYGRLVRMYSAHGSIPDAVDQLRPFAVTGKGSGLTAQKRIVTTTFDPDPRASYAKYAPYLISYRPDFEDQAALVASYICSKLAGRPARYAGDPRLRSSPRKFGMWLSSPNRAGRANLDRELQSRCNLAPNPVLTESRDATGVARMQQAGVTSVIVSASSDSPLQMTAVATQQGFFPEWIITGPEYRGLDSNFYARTYNQAQWTNAFGVTYDLRRGAVTEQPWYRAYREGCAACPEPTSATFGLAPQIYESMSLLFYGIQAAGPRLSAASLDKGLHAVPAVASDDPFRPAAYFAPGNYTFVKDAMELRWDPAGQAPDSAQAGCYRLVDRGLRHRVGEWPAGDSSIGNALEGPCQGDQVR